MSGGGLVDALRRRLSYPEEVQSVIARHLEQFVRPGRRLRILDVGCGTTSELAAFNRMAARRSCYLIGLDIHGPTVAWCRANGFHDEYVLGDAADAALLPDVDVIVATDLVEHFEKSEALDLIAQFERKASTAVLLLTPNGYIFNPFTPDNPYMEHKCGFSAAEFRSLGFTCLGLGGPRWLRTSGSLPRGPKAVSLPLLAILGRLMRGFPEQSFHLLVSKRLAPGGATSRSAACAPPGSSEKPSPTEAR